MEKFPQIKTISYLLDFFLLLFVQGLEEVEVSSVKIPPDLEDFSQKLLADLIFFEGVWLEVSAVLHCGFHRSKA